MTTLVLFEVLVLVFLGLKVFYNENASSNYFVPNSVLLPTRRLAYTITINIFYIPGNST